LALKLDPDALCPVCSRSDPRLRYRLAKLRVYECTDCALVYLWPRLTEGAVRDLFHRLYTEGEGSLPELKSYYDFTYDDSPANPLVQLYERWLNAIECMRPVGRILDIGCGTGLFLAVARRRGWEPYGVDACAEAITHARDHFGLDVWEGEFTDFTGNGKTFDAITMWDIIEHARDPLKLLRAARQQLEPRGVLGISTPNQRSVLDVVAGGMYRLSGARITRPLEKFYIEQHFLYFSPDTLRATLGRADLEVAQLRRELTDLRRLTISPTIRLALRVLFAAARVSGLENRLFVLARAAGAR
jgi:2-polyprenyl-3-methyl-5-hydroxy-6-metoxy-1,4-benzoquinol methylase